MDIRSWQGASSGSGGTIATSVSYNLRPLKDLVIFEERIRQNINNFRRIRRALRVQIVGLGAIVLGLLFLHARFLSISVIFSSPTIMSLAMLIILYISLLYSTVKLVSALRAWHSANARNYEEQCQKTLRQFNLQITFGREKELTFVKRLPKRLAELLEAYRTEYRARRALQSTPGPRRPK